MVMPDPQSPPPFFGLRPARTPVGKLHHAIVRKLLASGMKAGTAQYNAILDRHGIAPISLDGFPHEPMLRVRRVFLNGSPGLEFPGYRPLANAEYVGPMVPARRAVGPDTPLPTVVLDPTSKVVAVSQGTVDNGDPGKLIVPTIEALKDARPSSSSRRPRGWEQGSCAPGSRSRTSSSRTSSTMTTSSPTWRRSLPAAGSAAVLAAFLHGVPVVGAGKREGKNDVNARVGHNKLGIDLRRERPKPSAIRKAVGRVLNDPTYAANVAALRSELLTYDPMTRIEAALTAATKNAAT